MEREDWDRRYRGTARLCRELRDQAERATAQLRAAGGVGRRRAATAALAAVDQVGPYDVDQSVVAAEWHRRLARSAPPAACPRQRLAASESTTLRQFTVSNGAPCPCGHRSARRRHLARLRWLFLAGTVARSPRRHRTSWISCRRFASTDACSGQVEGPDRRPLLAPTGAAGWPVY